MKKWIYVDRTSGEIVEISEREVVSNLFMMRGAARERVCVRAALIGALGSSVG